MDTESRGWIPTEEQPIKKRNEERLEHDVKEQKQQDLPPYMA